jgi:thiamine biosynthesis lipoprotein
VIVHAEPVMGTVVSFHVEPGECPAVQAHAAVAAACARLHELDDLFSTWKPGSPISRFRAGLLRLKEAPPEMALVLELCEEARVLSLGWFDPWAMPGGFDPTGLVKGWATEQALDILRLAGVEAAIVNGGGDIAVLGLPKNAHSWRIGVRHPWRPDALACVLETASATVVGSSLPLCDALATALVVADDYGPEIARSLEGYEAYIVGVDGKEDATEGIVFATEGVR